PNSAVSSRFPESWPASPLRPPGGVVLSLLARPSRSTTNLVPSRKGYSRRMGRPLLSYAPASRACPKSRTHFWRRTAPMPVHQHVETTALLDYVRRLGIALGRARRAAVDSLAADGEFANELLAFRQDTDGRGKELV